MNPIGRSGRQFIGGSWVESTSSSRFSVENPSTGTSIAEVCEGSSADAAAAVRAASEAFPDWSRRSLGDRLGMLREAARRLTEETDSLAELISSEVGTPLDVSKAAQVTRPLQVMRSLCDAAQEFPWTSRVDASLVVREPVGVVVAITPWNFPLHQTIAKVAAALAAGCTVVHKPSELAPLSAYALADALNDAGIPPGVFNVVTGTGASVGEALISHPDVDAISFTGSTAVGRHIGAVGAETVKRIALELGGKGPSVVLPGADVVAAAKATAARCFTNSGQVCAALARLIVPREELPAAEETLAAFVAAQVIGDPMEPGTTLGPLVSAAQLQRASGLLDDALASGARLVAGGPDVELPATGYFMAPAVLSDVDPKSVIAREEVFGPVLCLIAYDDPAQAVEIANDSQYGLVGAVWGPDDASAVHIASQLRVGMIGVNGGRINVKAPFGGYKQSGIGREFGSLGLEEFLEVKTVNFSAPEAATWPQA